MPAGRPLKFKNVKVMQKLIDAYFEETEQEIWTITGLALALDTTRQTLVDYGEKDEFTDAIKKAKTKVENAYEISLRQSGRSGDIFGLKNFGWSDKSGLELTGEGGGPVDMKWQVEVVEADAEDTGS